MTMKISSVKSIVGTTWVLQEGACVLGYFKSKTAAKKRRALINRERKARRQAA